ncbi:FkbM family methyltransferase [Fulvivirgaceae bacterium BMA10]|uniref:FkbM family methyltransferase n=1 Tax=Splendidivirga corallicola TaxID=3051826 RepID=A0ABT8KTZ4_9BACT|nr:FkbM family methyltransferase [Fulvivirgaceae bacterium BMA10]
MISQLKEKLREKRLKNQLKRKFEEYGYEINKFPIDGIGEIRYAQWMHPFEKLKIISEPEISFYRQFSNDGGMIIDIGAHTGDTTLHMALAVGKGGLVLGIEPNKYVYKILEKNAALNHELTNIVPLCFAATKEEGDFTFNYSDASFCNGGYLSQIQRQNHKHKYTLEVQGKNIQDFLFAYYKKDLDRLNLIKIDAEGYDKEILKTIPEILWKYKPFLIIECYNKLNSIERMELFDTVHDFGYKLFHLENFNRLIKLQEIRRHQMNDRKHFDILAIHKDREE